MSARSGSLRIAVASGKGGTGKTTLATSLAAVLASSGDRTTYLDADVEAPNGHIFLKPEIQEQIPVQMPVPVVDEDLCTHCGRCAEFCQYSAIVSLGRQVLVFPELCHGCGGCRLVCPEKAIHEVDRRIGVVETGQAGSLSFVQGRLDIGHPLAPEVIRAAQGRLPAEGIQIVDAPPGTACAAVQAVEGADYVLLVAEPTPFGLNDLRLIVEMLGVLELPFGVVINRADRGVEPIRRYCAGIGAEILLEIPDDRNVAETYSRGELIAEALPEYRSSFAGLFEQVERRVRR